MMKRSSMFCVAICLGIWALTPAPAAAVTITEVVFTDTTVSESPPTQIVEFGGFLFAFGQVTVGVVEGDLTGEIRVYGNAIVDLQTGETVIYGTFTIETATRAWNGPFAGEVLSNGFANGTFFGVGTDGSLIIGDFTQIDSDPSKFLDEATIIGP